MADDYEFSVIISTALNMAINHNHNLALDHEKCQYPICESWCVNSLIYEKYPC